MVVKRKYNTTGLNISTKRVCNECGNDYFGRGNQKYCSRICLSRNEYSANMMKPSWRMNKLLAAAKNRATSKKLPFDLTLEYLEELWEQSGGKCTISNRNFDLTAMEIKGQVNPNAPSIDRIFPHLGYVKGNIRLITYHMNVALSEYGLEAFVRLAKDVAFR